MRNTRFIGPRFFGLLAMLAAAPASLLAGDVSWSVSVAASDSASVTGGFIYNSDTGAMRTWSISTSGGDQVNFPNFTYTPQNSAFFVSGNTLVFQGPLDPAVNPASNGFRQLRLGPFNSPLDDTGGARGLVADPFGNIECYNCAPFRTLTGSLAGTPLPDLTVTKSHTGTFTVGQTGAIYTITVSNAGVGSAIDTAVMDVLPMGLTPAGLSGTGWSCTLANLTCARSDGLGPGLSYPPITLTVNVDPAAPAVVTNTVQVAGMGDVNPSNDTATDPTAILHPDMTISLSPGGPFRQGDVGDTYSIQVGNAGNGASYGTVMVTAALPSGLTATAIGGSGWGCALASLSCTRTDSLIVGLVYPPILMTVNVAPDAPASLTTTATVSGGSELNATNDLATNVTNLTFPPLSCVANVAAPPLLRQEGGAEQAGDMVLVCTGGVPTAAGQPVPVVNFSVSLGAPATVGGRLPGAIGEALALVDEPGSGLPNSDPQVVCATPSDPCQTIGTGNGQGGYDGSQGRQNVFTSTLAGQNTLAFSVPFDPPGLGVRILRFTNLRVDARAVPSGTPVPASVSASGPGLPPIANPQQIVGLASPGQTITLQGGGTVTNRISQFNVVFQEAFGSSLRPRSAAAFAGNDTSPAPANQNVPGKIYNTETAFYNSAFPVLPLLGDLSRAGLADSGTRLIVKVSGVPQGVQLMVPGAVHSTAGSNTSIGVLRLITSDANGAGAFAPNGTAFSLTPMSTDTSGNAWATYEVLSTDPLQIETVTIPVTPVYPSNSATTWLSAQVIGGQAPLDATSGGSLTAPVPRFSNPTILTAAAPPVISTTSLPGATAGQAYNFALGATGGVSPYTWSASGLPSFLTLSNSGVLSGTFPIGSLSTYNFAVSVKDSQNVSVSVPVTIAVTTPTPLSIPTTLPPGVPGLPYNFLFAAIGGTAPYSFSGTGLPSFLALSASGPLTGTIPSNPLGSYSFTITVTDADRTVVSVGITLKINRPPLSVNISQIPGISVGLHFSVMLTSAGVPPITWTATGLPSWMTLSTDGILQGTPPAGANQLQAGNALAHKTKNASSATYGFTITATDATGNSGSSNVNVTVAPPPLVVTTSQMLPGAMEGKAYSTQLSASGGTPPYNWTAAGLGSGFSLSAVGVLSGTPTAGSAGAVSFQATVQDSDGATQSATFTVPVTSSTNQLTITSPAMLPVAGAGLPYTATLTASGGTPPYIWSETGIGTGLALSSQGIVSGTAASPATLGFTGQVTDATGATASLAFRLGVISKFGINTPSPIAAGIVGVPYFQLFGAIGGTQPYQWSIDGALPAGLAFTSNGVISGTPTAPGAFSVNVTVRDSASNAATVPFQITVQPPANVDLVLSAGSLAFSAQAGGAPPPAQSVGVNATRLSSIQFSSSTDASWLRLSTNAGPTPGSIGVFADQTGLVPGFYQGTIIVTSPNTSSKSVPVSLTVLASAPSISASPSSLQLFASASSSAPATSAILVTSTSESPVAFQTNVVDLPFLTVSPQQGSVMQNSAAVLNLSAGTHNLAPGFYRGRVEITYTGGTAIVFVTIQAGSTGRLILSSRGTTLDAQEGTAIAGPATQSFTVLGADATDLHFTTSIVGSAPFLTLGSTGGVANVNTPASVPFTVNATGLSRGVYYGRIRVSSPDATNSPLEFLVVLNVRAPGVTPDLNSFPSGLAFVAGGASQTIQVYTDSGPTLPFQVAVKTQDGAPWLTAQAAQSTISATSPAQVTVNTSAAGLAPGIYRGFVALAPASAQVRTVAITLIVPSKGSVTTQVEGPRPAAGTCTPSQLVLTQTGLSGNFTTAAAWPRLISAQLTNDCGAAIPAGNVVASFSNGDPPLSLDPSDPQSGVYSINWAPSSAASPISVTLSATVSGFAPASTTVSGGVSPNTVPIVAQGGVLHLLNPKPNGLLAPGTIVQIFGTGLAASAVIPTYPPPADVNGTSVLISGTAVPLYYVSPTQINAELPFELTAGREYQVLVSANGGYTNPQAIQSAQAAPGVASFADGHVIAQHSDYSLVSGASPAKPGESLVIYLAGMGATDVPVATGAPAPSGPLANASIVPRILVDGQSAKVLFAGLTPQAVGLYQINFTVPAGIHSGDVALEVSQGSVSANKTLLTIAPQVVP